MAKHPNEAGRPHLIPVETHKRFKRPYAFAVCGCGAKAEYEVYEHREPHCMRCMLDAVDCETYVMVRRIDGGYNDAS